MKRELSEQHVRRLKQWYIGQLIVSFLSFAGVIGYSFLFGHEQVTARRVIILLFSVLTVILALKIPFEKELQTKQKIRQALRKCNYYFQTMGQAILLPIGLSYLMLILHRLTHLSFLILTVIFLVYLLFMYIPVTYFVYMQIESLAGRIILLCFLIAEGISAGSQLIMEYTRPKQVGYVLQTINETQAADVVAILISVAFLMYLWGFKLPSFTYSKQANWGVVTFLVIFSLWYVIWNGFGSGSHVSDILFKYDFSMAKINLKMVLTALTTIQEEWFFRFAILSLCLRALKNNRHQIEWAVCSNGILFGLWHFANGFAGQSWSATFEQMLSAGAAGLLFAAIYLYTRNIGFPIVIHFLNDFLGLSSSASMIMSAPGTIDWLTTIGQVVVFILIVIFLMTGKRKQAIQATLDYEN